MRRSLLAKENGQWGRWIKRILLLILLIVIGFGISLYSNAENKLPAQACREAVRESNFRKDIQESSAIGDWETQNPEAMWNLEIFLIQQMLPEDQNGIVAAARYRTFSRMFWQHTDLMRAWQVVDGKIVEISLAEFENLEKQLHPVNPFGGPENSMNSGMIIRFSFGEINLGGLCVYYQQATPERGESNVWQVQPVGSDWALQKYPGLPFTGYMSDLMFIREP